MSMCCISTKLGTCGSVLAHGGYCSRGCDSGITLPCHICDYNGEWYKPLRTKQALAVHRTRKHKLCHVSHFYVSGTVCPTCLIQFHSRFRVLEHLRDRSSICLDHLMKADPILSLEETQILDKTIPLESKSIKGKKRIDCYRVAGPLCDLPFPEGKNAHFL